MRHGSLFSGIGGFDLAAEWMGWENVFHCEWNEFGQKVLKHYFPEAESFNDITKSDFTKYEGTIDIISGGFPCQPYSMAGKRKGKEDDRHLWPQMLRVIREVKPRIVVGENVFGLLSWNGGMVFDEVHSDLEAEGYQVQAVVIPAAAVNAPHGRDRVWFIAYSDSISNRREREQSRNSCEQGRSSQTNQRERDKGQQQPLCNSAVSGDVTNTQSSGNTEQQGSYREGENRQSSNNGKSKDATNSNGTRKENNQRTNHRKTEKVWGENESNVSRELCGDGDVTNSQRSRRVQILKDLQPKEPNGKRIVSDGREWDAANSGSRRIQGYGRMGKKGEFQTNEFNKNNRQRQPRMDWEQFPTQSPICSRNDGISSQLDGITFSKWRAESVKAYGNAIVPQVAFEIFKAIELTLKNG